MKKLFFIAALMVATFFAAQAQSNAKFQIEGPEKSYNMVRVTNQTHFEDFTCSIYFLMEKDGKMVVQSALGTFTLHGFNDYDSNKIRTEKGQWIGVKLPDELTGVTVNISYKDMPFFDIVEIILTDEAGVPVGEEF